MRGSQFGLSATNLEMDGIQRSSLRQINRSTTSIIMYHPIISNRIIQLPLQRLFIFVKKSIAKPRCALGAAQRRSRFSQDLLEDVCRSCLHCETITLRCWSWFETKRMRRRRYMWTVYSHIWIPLCVIKTDLKGDATWTIQCRSRRRDFVASSFVGSAGGGAGPGGRVPWAEGQGGGCIESILSTLNILINHYIKRY